MPTKVAVISSRAFKERLTKLGRHVMDVELDFYIYEHPAQTPTLLKSVKPCDVLFITGTLPYLYSKPMLENWPIPWTYLKQDEFAVSNTLLAMSANHRIPVHRLSIDVMDKLFVENVLRDIEYKGDEPFIHEINTDTDDAALFALHQRLWQQQQIDFVITSSHNTYEKLQQASIPSMYILDSSTSILRRLEETKALSRMTKSESAKVVVGMLDIPPEYMDFANTVAATVHGIQQPFDNERVEIYTTMGHLKHALDHQKLTALIDQAPFDIKMAFGYGQSINEAEQNALYAIQYTAPNTICIIDERKNLINPASQQHENLKLQIKDPYIMQLAKETQLSPLNISKIIAFSKGRQTTQFTAHDLSEYLQVTRRTTERILKKLVDNNYVRVVGEEMGYQQGRPRTVYMLDFAIY
ncbi:hypothetical protein [Kurthia huakuii]|uniref:hypothetical protein n=1 Tax=Kurthia huakuii TaxID=1421019 RepID=UPI0004975F77|nr:hypothetical protein [Kurthia huakuii]MBM7701121.1 hypothetical protein [Kurthia huakuii]